MILVFFAFTSRPTFLLASIKETVTILDIIHRPVFILKHNASETGIYLRFQVEPTQMVQIERASPSLSLSPGLKTETEFSLRNIASFK
jgi:hypothetical protein